MFRIRTKADLSGAERKVSDANILRAKRVVANQVLMDTANYIPMKDGNLRASGQIAIDGSAVSWDTVYARAQFYGTNGIVVFRKYTTPGTGKLWYDKSAEANVGKWKRVAAKEMGF